MGLENWRVIWLVTSVDLLVITREINCHVVNFSKKLQKKKLKNYFFKSRVVEHRMSPVKNEQWSLVDA